MSVMCGMLNAVQKAHVGIGISGVEGLQAACASDYSIAQVLSKLMPHFSY